MLGFCVFLSERGGAERRILVPGCDGVGGSAGEPCLFVCLCACSGWVAACWLFLILSKERRRGRATHPGDPPREPGDPPRDPTLILTLGPKFYIFSVLSPRICFCFVNPYFLAGIAAFCEILLLAVSKYDLKRSKKARFFGPDRLFHELLPPEGD